MIRTSQHILKYQTSKKTDFLESLFFSYEISLREYLEKILNGDISLKRFMSSKDLPNCEIYHSQWKQLVYKQASQIVRSQTELAYKRRKKKYKYIYSTLKRREEKGYKLCKIYRDFLEKHYHDLYLKDILKSKYFYIPTLKNLTIEVESKLFDLKESKKYFNCWLNLRLPFFYSNKKRAIAIKLPVNYYSYQKKRFCGWKRKNTISLKKKGNNYFINFFYEKNEPEIKKIGKEIGFDQGYKKLLSDSNGNHYGRELKDLYEKISKKKQGSKAFKNLLKHRDNEINRICNEIDLSNIKQIYLERLKYVKAFSKQNHKINSKFMNKLQRWSYSKVVDKLKRLCQENGILLSFVPPAYTSQTCSKCGTVEKESRQGEVFHCRSCGYQIDADTNGAINILKRGSLAHSEHIIPLSSKNKNDKLSL